VKDQKTTAPGKLLPMSIWALLVRHVNGGKRSTVQEAVMTKQPISSEILRSIVGGPLVGLGLYILMGNLDTLAAQLRQLLGSTTGEGLGALSSVVLAASGALQSYASDHQAFLQGLLRMLVSFWPLLLIIGGTILLRDVLTDKVETLPTPRQYFRQNSSTNNSFKNDVTECRFHCPWFDV
jgi:hypothetical protein